MGVDCVKTVVVIDSFRGGCSLLSSFRSHVYLPVAVLRPEGLASVFKRFVDSS